jgi:hypothetical protein
LVANVNATPETLPHEVRNEAEGVELNVASWIDFQLDDPGDLPSDSNEP